ncbi:MAG: hypothetical protein SH809_14525 [Rhodothermales bacterium]|nr:hypothetical protein [Rhodothermales bacterium]
MGVPVRSLQEITEQAIRVLVRELGAADAARFIGQFTTGYGDYTAERKELFKDVTIDHVIQEIYAARKETR